MNKLSSLNESFIDDVIARARDKSIVRKEDILKTCIGINLILENPNIDYNYYLSKLLTKKYNEFDSLSIDKLNSFSPDEIKNIVNNQAPYTYLIYDGKYGTSLVSDFNIDNFKDEMQDYNEEEISDKDFKSLCECASKKLKEVGDSLEYVPQKNSSIHWYSNNGSVKQEYSYKYTMDYSLCLIDENTFYNYECETNNENLLEDFIIDFENNFSYNQDFITWTYRDGINIGIPINVENLMNFKKYKEYTENFFKK